MKLGILHLSDCHISDGTEPFLKRVDEVIAATRKFAAPPSAWLIIFSGDLSNHGKETQLEHGVSFLNAVEAKLSSQHSKPVFVVKVPGNHDCLIPDEEARKKLTDAIRNGDLAATKDFVLAAQNPFWAACPHPTSHPINNKLVFLQLISIAEKLVAVVGFNSSWMSDKHEKQGQIEFDPAWLRDVEDWVCQNNPDLVVTVTHHPLYWQGEQIHRGLWTALEKLTDLLFTGHEHADGSFVRSTQDSAITVIEGGLLYKNGLDKSCFNVVNIDLQNQHISRHSCNWDFSKKLYSVEPRFDQQFQKNTKRERYSFQPKWEVELETSSLKYCHPRKSPIPLSSYYVWPHLSIISRKKATEVRIHGSQALIEWMSDHKRMRIVGSIKSGKTAMLKMLYRELLRVGYVPLFIDLAQSDANIDALIARSVNDQYKNLEWADLASNERLVILADNFDKCRVKLSKRIEILESISNGAKYSVISTNSREDLEYLTSGTVSEVLDSYRIIQIEMLTHTERSDLLFSWAKVNAPLDMEDNQLEREVEQGNDQISNILGNNLVPATPLIVIMLWRELQTGNTPSNVGAQGYLYDHLIKYMFEKSNIKQRDLGFDVRYNFLSHIAYEQFDKNRVLLPDDVDVVMARFVAETELEPNLEQLIGDCIFLGILKERDGGLCFGLEYIHYYFTAYFIWQHKAQAQGVAKVLEQITDNLYEQANTQITIFYTYLSNDEEIMRKMLKLAKACLTGAAEFNYDSLKPAQLALSREVKRVVDLSKRSIALDAAPQVEVTLASAPPAAEAELREIIFARRLALVLGQIVRNFPVTLANKLGVEARDSFVREGYRLELIALRLTVKYIEAHAGELIQHMESILGQEGIRVPEIPAKRRELLESAANILLGCIISQAAMEIPHTLCSKDILSVHKGIISSQAGANPIYDVVDAAIQIDFKRDYPLAFIEQKAKMLWKRDENAWETLRNVVYRSLLKYSRETRVIQSLCTTFDFEHKSLHLPLDKSP